MDNGIQFVTGRRQVSYIGAGLRQAQLHQLALGRAWDWGGGTVWPLQLISPDDDVLEVLRSKRCLFSCGCGC